MGLNGLAGALGEEWTRWMEGPCSFYYHRSKRLVWGFDISDKAGVWIHEEPFNSFSEWLYDGGWKLHYMSITCPERPSREEIDRWLRGEFTEEEARNQRTNRRTF